MRVRARGTYRTLTVMMRHGGWPLILLSVWTRPSLQDLLYCSTSTLEDPEEIIEAREGERVGDIAVGTLTPIRVRVRVRVGIRRIGDIAVGHSDPRMPTTPSAPHLK